MSQKHPKPRWFIKNALLYFIRRKLRKGVIIYHLFLVHIFFVYLTTVRKRIGYVCIYSNTWDISIFGESEVFLPFKSPQHFFKTILSTLFLQTYDMKINIPWRQFRIEIINVNIDIGKKESISCNIHVIPVRENNLKYTATWNLLCVITESFCTFGKVRIL